MTNKTISELNVDQFTKQASDYARLTSAAPDARKAKRLELLAPRSDDRVLDVACGPGHLLLDLAPYVSAAVGIDLTPAMLEQAAQAAHGVSNVSWRLGDVYALPVEAGAFSLVVCQSAFHHFERPRDVLAEMARVSRVGGRVVVSDVTPSPAKRDDYDHLERMRDPSHVRCFTTEELRALASDLPLRESALWQSMTPAMPLEPILRASRPTEHTLHEVRALLEHDARSGADRWGFSSHYRGETLMVAYPTTLLVWERA